MRILNSFNFTLHQDDTLRDQVISYAINHTICRGDSGAGYLYQEENVIFLAAINNWISGKPCGALKKKQQGATAVYPHLEWICLYSGVCREIEMYEEVIRRKEEIEKTIEVVTF